MRGRTCDVFCRVVDHFGDAGVCWRLARQLRDEHGARVRLIVDDVATLRAIAPELHGALPQHAGGIDLSAWPAAGELYAPADVVIEAFGCGLPDPYVEAMARRPKSPVWIVLEYLSAEHWVSGYHGLPSPHPRFGIERHFFFPGFGQGTGGLLRERGLAQRRAAFDGEAAARLWRDLGFQPPAAGTTVVSMFAYAGAPLRELLRVASAADAPALIALPCPPGRPANALAGLLEQAGMGGMGPPASRHAGALEIRLIPFLPQERYDELLWSCHVNFVRGEDSFVRAQWAARPFVWHVYPQDHRAHWAKLDAFLDLYRSGLDARAAQRLRTLWHAWNGMDAAARLRAAWRSLTQEEVILSRHAQAWAESLEAQPDLVSNLTAFCRERLK